MRPQSALLERAKLPIAVRLFPDTRLCAPRGLADLSGWPTPAWWLRTGARCTLPLLVRYAFAVAVEVLLAELAGLLLPSSHPPSKRLVTALRCVIPPRLPLQFFDILIRFSSMRYARVALAWLRWSASLGLRARWRQGRRLIYVILRGHKTPEVSGTHCTRSPVCLTSLRFSRFRRWRDDLAWASNDLRADDPMRFQQVDQPPGARIANAEPPLQHGDGGFARFAHDLFGLGQQVIFRRLFLVFVLDWFPGWLGAGKRGLRLPPVFNDA